jgi:hypothetical protein
MLCANPQPVSATNRCSEVLKRSLLWAELPPLYLALQQQRVASCRHLASLPLAQADGTEIASVNWLHWRWLAHSQGWLPVHGQQPGARYLDVGLERSQFNIPGPASLATRMLQRWVAASASLELGLDHDNPLAARIASVPDCQIDEGR